MTDNQFLLPADTIVLVPTQGERELLLRLSNNVNPDSVYLCGFGPVVSAVTAANLLAEHRPRRVLLAGCCGSYLPDLPIGSAAVFKQVVMHGIGAGSGANHKPANMMGWPQLQSSIVCASDDDRIALELPEPLENRAMQAVLTCASASENADDIRHRLALFPDAAVEEMEGWGVATACAARRVPLTIIRGVSNVAGDRNKQNWDFPAALEAAAGLLDEVIAAL